MAEAVVLQYLNDTNRPWNITNVVDALQSTGYKKSQIQKALDTLAESARILCTENGKQKIYLALQTQSEVPPEQVREEEVLVAGLARQLDELKRQNAVLAAGACAPAKAEGHSGQNEGALQRAAEASRAAPPELRNLSALRTTEEMTAAAAALEAESIAMEAKLASMRDGRTVVTAEERAATEAVATAFYDAWVSRRRKFRELWDALLDATEKKPSALKEEIPFEDDAEAGADFEACKKAMAAVVAAARARPKPAR